jgi:hypothetical protein
MTHVLRARDCRQLLSLAGQKTHTALSALARQACSLFSGSHALDILARHAVYQKKQPNECQSRISGLPFNNIANLARALFVHVAGLE